MYLGVNSVASFSGTFKQFSVGTVDLDVFFQLPIESNNPQNFITIKLTVNGTGD